MPKLSLAKLERHLYAAADRMLWLNPSDNQGVRFWIHPVKAGMKWEEGRCALEG